MTGSVRACSDLGAHHGLAYARRYVTGWKCDRHTPSANAGRPESPPGPGWPPGAYIHQITTAPPAEQEPPS